jgi:uncharacterized protein (TIGR04255 family)
MNLLMANNHSDSELNFTRPPIVEAVVERRFGTPLSMDTMDNLRRKFEREFPAVSQMNEVSIAINQGVPQPQVNQSTVGYRLVNQAGLAVILLTTQAITFARLAPYPGWREFSTAAEEVFRTARDTMGYSTFSRIGVRYINRLDIPSANESGAVAAIRPEEYILIYPEYPEAVIPNIHGFTLQCVAPLPAIDCLATINVSTVQSPVPRHISLVFDIDVGRNANVPQREDEIAGLLEAIRREKNRIFDSCLTKKMKEYFN